MDIAQELKRIKDAVDEKIKLHLDKAIEKAHQRDRLVADALRYSKRMALSGGKRLRAALMYNGYLAGGGEDKDRILETSISVELIHLFLLIHDDIIDRDDLRHGIKTVNAHYRERGAVWFGKETANHFGDSMAIIIGDMVGAIGSQVIFDSGFPCERVHRALSFLQEIISWTVIGQAQDLYLEYGRGTDESLIMSMYENKTARYTVEGPLQLGLMLAGGQQALSKSLSDYALPIGVAFQIRDDILGIYGSEKKLGKQVGSDIEEGKMTLLVAKAREMCSKDEKKILDDLLGKKGVTDEDIEAFRSIITRSGSLAYAQEKMEALVAEGKQATSAITNTEAKAFLDGVADYIVKRET